MAEGGRGLTKGVAENKNCKILDKHLIRQHKEVKY